MPKSVARESAPIISAARTRSGLEAGSHATPRRYSTQLVEGFVLLTSSASERIPLTLLTMAFGRVLTQTTVRIRESH
jgi:hypothetical protein